MSFEEEFPGLVKDLPGLLDEENTWYRYYLMKNCLDKQRVRSVLLSYCSCRKDVIKESLLSAELCVCCKILKELRL